MQQVKQFNYAEDLNKWLYKYSKVYKIIDIKFQTPHVNVCRYLVHYEKPNKESAH